MTLIAAWVRNVADTHELVMAADSRLSGGSPERWDACPKVLTLPRTDAVLAFAGVTELAYPALLQMSRAIETHPGMTERRFDVTQLPALFVDILNQLISLVRTDSVESLHDSLAQTFFVLGGYSWKYQQFRIWNFVWRDPRRGYEKVLHRTEGSRKYRQNFLFVGDHAEAARNSLLDVLTSGHTRERSIGLDMEPLGVLERYINDKRLDEIGGAPQVVKVYRHMNVEPFAVMWPRGKNAQPTFAGRPLLDYERPFAPPLDLSSPELMYKHLKPKA